MEERNVWPAIVARECGMPQPVFHRYVAGQFPRVENLVPLARYFRVSMEYLLGVSDDRGAVVPAPQEPAPSRLVRDEVAPWNGDADLRAEVASWRVRAEAAERQVAALLQVIGRPPAEPPPAPGRVAAGVSSDSPAPGESGSGSRALAGQKISTGETIQGVDREVADTARDGSLRAARMLREASLRPAGKTTASTSGSKAGPAAPIAPATAPAVARKVLAPAQSAKGVSRPPPSPQG